MTGQDHREGAPRREGHSWRVYALGIAIVLLLILVIQNSQKVAVHFFFADTQTPLVLALLIAGALGAVIGWAWPHVRRDRKRQRELERD